MGCAFDDQSTDDPMATLLVETLVTYRNSSKQMVFGPPNTDTPISSIPVHTEVTFFRSSNHIFFFSGEDLDNVSQNKAIFKVQLKHGRYSIRAIPHPANFLRRTLLLDISYSKDSKGRQLKIGDTFRVGGVWMRLELINIQGTPLVANDDQLLAASSRKKKLQISNKEIIVQEEEDENSDGENCRECKRQSAKDNPLLNICLCQSRIHLKCAQKLMSSLTQIKRSTNFSLLLATKKGARCEFCRTSFKQRVINNGSAFQILQGIQLQTPYISLLQLNESLQITSGNSIEHYFSFRNTQKLVIGSDPQQCAVTLPVTPLVSRLHAQIHIQKNKLYLRALGTQSGTQVKFQDMIIQKEQHFVVDNFRIKMGLVANGTRFKENRKVPKRMTGLRAFGLKFVRGEDVLEQELLQAKSDSDISFNQLIHEK